MKKQLIEAIKAKFVGIDDNTAKRLAERAIAKNEAITNDDEVKVAVEAITLADVLKSVTDFSADDAVKKYEEKYGLEKGEKKEVKPTETTKPTEQKPNEVKPSEVTDPADAFKTLLNEFKETMASEFKSMKDELNAIKTGKLTETRRAQLEAVIKDLKDFQKKPYGRLQLDKMTDDEFQNLLSEVKEEVNDILADNKASSSGSITPALGGGHHEPGQVKEATKDEMDALMGKFNLQS